MTICEIVLQEARSNHARLYLLSQGHIEDKIDFGRAFEDGRLALHPLSWPTKSRAYLENWHPDRRVATGQETTIRGLWDKAVTTAHEIDNASIPFQTACLKSAFNCRAGVIACLWAMGYDYASPQGLENTHGTEPDFSLYGLKIRRPEILL